MVTVVAGLWIPAFAGMTGKGFGVLHFSPSSSVGSNRRPRTRSRAQGPLLRFIVCAGSYSAGGVSLATRPTLAPAGSEKKAIVTAPGISVTGIMT